jgi:archaellum component FlaC
MEVLSFILGVTSVLLILGVIFIVDMTRTQKKLKSKVEKNQKFIDSLYQELNRNVELVNRRIDGEIDRVNRLYDELSRLISTVDSNVNRKIDSINQKIEDIENNGCKPVKKKKNVL